MNLYCIWLTIVLYDSGIDLGIPIYIILMNELRPYDVRKQYCYLI